MLTYFLNNEVTIIVFQIVEYDRDFVVFCIISTFGHVTFVVCWTSILTGDMVVVPNSILPARLLAKMAHSTWVAKVSPLLLG
eukprot:SAG22_NODE_581_length_8895_cov_2.587767_9_plen_82_part_00